MPNAANDPNLGSDSDSPRRPGEWPIPTRHDPLGILAATRTVLGSARHVTVDEAAIDRFVAGQDADASPPPWDEALATRIADYALIAPGSAMEVEIRAATVWACKLIRRALTTGGRRVTAIEVDWLLWEAGQHLPAGTEPYHRTPTIFH